MIPIYCLKIVLKERDLDLVFQTFREVKEVLQNYFQGLKMMQRERKRIFIYVPSIGKILWQKFKYVIRWKLGNSGALSPALVRGRVSLVKLILLAKKFIQPPRV